LGFAFSKFDNMFESLKKLLKSGLEPQCYIGGTIPKAVVKLQPKTEQALVKMLKINSALFVYYEGNQGDVEARLKESKKILKKFGREMPHKYSQEWWENRHTYFEMSKELADENVYIHVFDLCVPKGNVLKARDKMNEAAKRFKLGDRISHTLFSATDAYTVALYLEDNEKSRKTLKGFEKEIIKVVHGLNGTIARTHGLGTLYSNKKILENEIGVGSLEILKILKQNLDPNNILNPGVLISGE
jgi:FAD/FMN-containing dehydrogenase